MSVIETELSKIFEIDIKKEYNDIVPIKFIPVRKDGNKFYFKINRMYNAPALSVAHIMDMVNLFGTKKIDINNYGSSGCETCDYGSQYGYNITVENPTRMIKELKNWIDNK